MAYSERAWDKPHEECGVFGIYDLAGGSVARSLYDGLVALQHRGQESAGMSISDTSKERGNLKTKKDMGLVSEVFSADDLALMQGNLGIGHVRYSTTGESTPQNAQPIAMNYIKGSLALVHNGNLVNAKTLKQQQMLRGQAHYTTTDSEVLAYEIVSARTRTPSAEAAVLEAGSQIRGGYAVLVTSPRKLIALRDPFGIKPLAFGRRENAWMFASESAAIAAAGGTFLRDVKPGEMIVITPDGPVSDTSLCHQKQAHCAFEYIYFARPDSVMDGVSVHASRRMAGRLLARWMKTDADLVTGVPDSGLAAAEGYAAEAQIPFALAFHKNSYIGRSFIKPTDTLRRLAVHQKLSVIEEVVRGKRVVLIDDSIVRGNTMRQIVDMLRQAGARAVHVRISSPPFLHPCYYGTDVSSERQLIAAEASCDEICKTIGADSLQYLTVADLRESAGGLPLCTACFDGEYPCKCKILVGK